MCVFVCVYLLACIYLQLLLRVRGATSWKAALTDPATQTVTTTTTRLEDDLQYTHTHTHTLIPKTYVTRASMHLHVKTPCNA